MKKILLPLAVLVFSVLVFSACTEENVQPQIDRKETGGAVPIRD